MAAIDLKLVRPSSVAIFRKKPSEIGYVVAFILSEIGIPSSKRVKMDLSTSRTHNKTFRATRNPVESSTASAILRDPEVFSVTGRLSANPLGAFGAAAVLGTLGSLVRRDLIEVGKLRAIADEREPVVVVTPERVYTSMAITSMSEVYDKASGNGSILSLTFQEIRIVSPVTLSGVVDVDTLVAAQMETLNMGTQSPTDVADPGGFG